MQNVTKILDMDTLNTINANEKKIGKLNGKASAITEERQKLKMTSYCLLVSGMAGAKLEKGNFKPADRTNLKGDLMDAGGLTDSMAEKYIKNVAGAKNKLKDHGINSDNITPAGVAEIFEDQGITSEAKLIKLLSGDSAKSKVEQLVDKVAGKRSRKKDKDGNSIDGDAWLGGLKDEDLPEFHNKLADALRLRSEIKKASQAAGDKAQAEIEQVNAMCEQLGAA